MRLSISLMCLLLTNLVAYGVDYPVPRMVGDSETLGHGVQRTLHLLSTSTAEQRNTVKILFYGQSITEQHWWKQVADDLRQRFPHADLVIKNRAIGGHSSQRLIKTAEADLYPFYPDLVIFHVYGSHLDYETLIRRIRERTTAEVLILNDHIHRVQDLKEETDPAVLTPQTWNAFMNHCFLPQLARQYGAELVNQRAAWKQYLHDYSLNPADLLRDNIHLNEHGCFVMAELVKPHLKVNPVVNDQAWQAWVKTHRIGHEVQQNQDRLTLTFVGNRVDAIASKQFETSGPVKVWIDGKRPSEISELRTFTRVSHYPQSNWPCLLQVQSEAPLLIEDWTLTLTETSEDLKTVKFTLKGSRTGDDGAGITTERFVSRSGRIVIEPDDWNLAYCARVFKRTLPKGHQITWQVLPLYQDEIHFKPSTDPSIEQTLTLAQGLAPGIHQVELRGTALKQITALRSYCPPGMPQEPAEFFVSPQGDDHHKGTRHQPFATVARAQEAVRAQRKEHPHQAAIVTLLGGHYELTDPWVFKTKDSGASALKPVLYRAEPGAEIIVSGGQHITGWQRDTQRPGVWKVHLPQARATTPQAWCFEQLWINGQRAIRARTPNWWQFHLLKGAIETPLEGKPGRFIHTYAADPKVLADLASLDPKALCQIQTLLFHKWDTTREWLQAVDAQAGQFVTHGSNMKSWNPVTRDCLFFLENALPFLDAPGEWFLDQEGWLYYHPHAHENMLQAEVVAPRLDRFVTIAGETDDPQTWVRHLHFEGLQFRYGDYRIPKQGLPPNQAALNVDTTGIQVDRAHDIQFRNCSVEHIGGTAFWFKHACRDCRVEYTHMIDLGMSGVRIGETKFQSGPGLTRSITIDNCILSSGGRISPPAVGVWIGHSPDNVITHCDISDFFYTAVSVGWRWGYSDSAAKRNRIEYNHLHHIGYRILSDMGGVYTLGPSEGTRICYNRIHDVYSTRYGGWGLYPDEGSTGILFENNLVYDVRDGCIHQHYGKNNLFRNNILAFSEEGQIAITRAEPHLSYTFENNIVVWDKGHLLGYHGWKRGAKVILRNNLYWCLGSNPNFDFAGKTWAQWQAAGNDQGSLIADPLFKDAVQRDFRLPENSPAKHIGFVPFDLDRAGVYGNDAWQKVAASGIYPKPYVVPPPEPITLHDNFESGRMTPLLNLATLNHENRRELIAVTDAQAAEGSHSLRIQDAPDLKASYNPHLYWDPRYTQGQADLSYAIYLEKGARVQCEWRDKASPYCTGPSIQFQDDAIYVQNRKLMDIPSDQWIKVHMQTTLGQAKSHWQLKVTLPYGQSQSFDKLPCHPAWQQVRWVGFIGLSPGQQSFYLDEVAMTNQ